jgi:hypothetical protein
VAAERDADRRTLGRAKTLDHPGRYLDPCRRLAVQLHRSRELGHRFPSTRRRLIDDATAAESSVT